MSLEERVKRPVFAVCSVHRVNIFVPVHQLHSMKLNTTYNTLMSLQIFTYYKRKDLFKKTTGTSLICRASKCNVSSHEHDSDGQNTDWNTHCLS